MPDRDDLALAYVALAVSPMDVCSREPMKPLLRMTRYRALPPALNTTRRMSNDGH